MTLQSTDITDPRLVDYAQLKRQTKQPGISDRFVCEGRLVTERLLASDYPVASILIADRKRPWYQQSSGLIGDVPVYVIRDEEMEQLVGFQFHSGILSCGLRQTPRRLAQRIEGWWQAIGEAESEARQTLLAFPHLTQEDNLGSILRSARALGAGGVLLDRRAPDPFSRRVLRVSMGHALSLPIYRAEALLETVGELKASGYRVIAVEADADMVPLKEAPVAARQILVLGNEFEGVTEPWRQLADQLVGIPMKEGVDSLNVAVTTAIVLHHYCG